jgi:hypothetical protein
MRSNRLLELFSKVFARADKDSSHGLNIKIYVNAGNQPLVLFLMSFRTSLAAPVLSGSKGFGGGATAAPSDF